MAPPRSNPRHPMALQAEVKAQLAAEGKLDEHGNRKKPKGGPKIPAPPPPATANATMLRTSGLEERKAAVGAGPSPTTPRDRLETLPDDELLEKATVLGLEGETRDDLIQALLDAGAEG